MTMAVEVEGLQICFGNRRAVEDVALRVTQGRCHGLFGLNGAGKTTTLKSLLGLVPPDRGSVRVFGLDPLEDEAAVKRRLAWVPDAPGVYPWMSVRDALDYAASFRPAWDAEVERHLLASFGLDERAPAQGLSKGQRTQLGLIAAIAADVDLLILDEPTSGLDPVVRRQFIQTIIGAFQERNPGHKTLLLSTHLISEFEGVVDEFTVIDRGRTVLSAEADEARSRFRRLRATFPAGAPAVVPLATVSPPRRGPRSLELVVSGGSDDARAWLAAHGALTVEVEALTLEEIFLSAVGPR
jgi:ABC-2 type transport system ATP-binding protein